MRQHCLPKGSDVVPCFLFYGFLVRDYYIRPKKELHRRVWVYSMPNHPNALNTFLESKRTLMPRTLRSSQTRESPWSCFNKHLFRELSRYDAQTLMLKRQTFMLISKFKSQLRQVLHPVQAPCRGSHGKTLGLGAPEVHACHDIPLSFVFPIDGGIQTHL